MGRMAFCCFSAGATQKAIPDAFYDFARGAAQPAVNATAACPPLNWCGVTVDDWPRWRQTKVVSEWQVGRALDAAPFVPQLDLRDAKW